MKLPNLFTPGNFSFPLYAKKRDLLKVLFISHTGNLGGAERSLLDLIDQFKERGIACKVIIPDEGLIERELKDLSVGYKIIPFEWWAQVEKESVKKLAQAALKNNNAILEIANEIKEYNPDIVYSNTIVIPWGAIAAHLTGKIHIWHIREFGVKDHGLNFNLGYAQSLKIIDQLSDAVFVNSKAVKKEISKVIKKSKVFQFYNYIAPKFEGSDTRIQNPDAFKLLLLGTITPSKGQMEALKALKQLGKYRVDLKIIGSVANKSYLTKLKKFIKNNNLGEIVQIENFTKEPYSLIANSDAVLVCSKNEAFGRVVAEAMFLKKPVIGAKSGGVTEQISNYQNGLLYTPGKPRELAKKIEYLITHPKARKRIARNSQKTVRQNFNRKKSINSLLKTMLDLKNLENKPTHLSYYIN